MNTSAPSGHAPANGTPTMHSGSCLCGGITYSAAGELGPLSLCHCHRCRKANGTAFLAGVVVDTAGFRLDDPQGLLVRFESSPGVFRAFCGRCGSPLFSHRPGPPDVIRLRPGTLDTPYAGPVAAHIFHADRATWLAGADTAPTFAERP